jgi:hypothetical protein
MAFSNSVERGWEGFWEVPTSQIPPNLFECRSNDILPMKLLGALTAGGVSGMLARWYSGIVDI